MASIDNVARLRFARFGGLCIPPLMLGIGIGIGAVGSANAATVSGTITKAIGTAVSSIQCATTKTACLTVSNSTLHGVAIVGTSPLGLGVQGISTASSGVTGESQWSNGVNGKSSTGFAVHGVSTHSAGVVGTTNDASEGVLGTATDYYGVGVKAVSIGTALAASVSNPPYTGAYDFDPAVTIDASTTFGGAIQIASGDLSVREPSSAPAIVTDDASHSVMTAVGDSGYAVRAVNLLQTNTGGYGPPGDGVLGSSTFGNGVVGSTGSTGTDAHGDPIAAVSANASNGADLYLGYGKGTFEVTNDGGVNASGTITSAVSCAPTTCGDGVKRTSYAPRAASPTMEDVGRAQLTNGAAVVRFDPAFAGTIDAGSDYSVFLTPEGESRGLFVTRRTPLGFEVRENLGGRSSLAFSYRIVATPYRSAAPRLPAVNTQRFAAVAIARQRAIIEAMLQRSAQARAKLGKAAASKAKRSLRE